MRTILCSLLFALALLPAVVPAQELEGWKLVFQDEFNGSGKPSQMKWQYEYGFVRNREPQWYSKDLANVRQRNGALELTALQLDKPHKNPHYNSKAPASDWQKSRQTYTYTSGSLETETRFHFQYGKVEVRAKLSKGQGAWPAIWARGVKGNWPDCGEIDIMEYVWSSPQTAWSTLHFTGSDKVPTSQRSKGYTSPVVADGEWHTYGCEWDKDKITFFFDGQAFYTWDVNMANRPDGTNPFRAPHYLKLNLALGDPTNWGGKLDPSILPQTFYVDYVRIWQRPLPGMEQTAKKAPAKGKGKPRAKPRPRKK